MTNSIRNIWIGFFIRISMKININIIWFSVTVVFSLITSFISWIVWLFLFKLEFGFIHEVIVSLNVFLYLFTVWITSVFQLSLSDDYEGIFFLWIIFDDLLKVYLLLFFGIETSVLWKEYWFCCFGIY